MDQDERNRTRHLNDFQRSELAAAEKVEAAVSQKIEATLKQIDWNMMDKHLDTPEARSAFHQICNEVRVTLNRASEVSRWKQEDPYLAFYREKIYPKPWYSMMPFEWTRGKLPFKKGMLKIIGFGVPLVVASFIAGEFVGANKERSETGTVV